MLGFSLGRYWMNMSDQHVQGTTMWAKILHGPLADQPTLPQIKIHHRAVQ